MSSYSVPFTTAVTVRGANAFNNDLGLRNIVIVSSQPGLVYLHAQITLFNNSTVSANPGTFTLGVFVDGMYIGNATAVAPTIRVLCSCSTRGFNFMLFSSFVFFFVYKGKGLNFYNVTGYVVQNANNTHQRQVHFSLIHSTIANSVFFNCILNLYIRNWCRIMLWDDQLPFNWGVRVMAPMFLCWKYFDLWTVFFKKFIFLLYYYF